MQLTRAGDYGIQGMLYLASLPPGKEAFIRDIAKSRNLPASFLAKIFQHLSKAGLIHSHRGAKGGVVLSRPAEEISVLEIIEGIEGKVYLNRCLMGDESCKRQKVCPMHYVLMEAQKNLMLTFEKFSLQDLCDIEHEKLEQHKNNATQ